MNFPGNFHTEIFEDFYQNFKLGKTKEISSQDLIQISD